MGRHCCRAFEIRAALILWLKRLRQWLVSSMSKLDRVAARWHQAAVKHARLRRASGDENLPAAVFYLVERPDLRHPSVDEALWRVCRRRRIRQSLLPHQGRQDRSDARPRTALGDL